MNFSTSGSMCENLLAKKIHAVWFIVCTGVFIFFMDLRIAVEGMLLSKQLILI